MANSEGPTPNVGSAINGVKRRSETLVRSQGICEAKELAAGPIAIQRRQGACRSYFARQISHPEKAASATQQQTITKAAIQLRWLEPFVAAFARLSAITSSGIKRKVNAMPSGIRIRSSR
jgi:hypothetical protein